MICIDISFFVIGIDFELYVVTFENSWRISNQKLNDAGFCCGESPETWAVVETRRSFRRQEVKGTYITHGIHGIHGTKSVFTYYNLL